MAHTATPLKLPVWKKLLFTAVVLLPVVLAIELVLGICGYYPGVPQPTLIKNGVRVPAPNVNMYFAVCDRRLGFRNRPLGSFRSLNIVGHPVNTTDKYGYRNGFGWSPEGSEPIVLFVGDSITFCSEVNDDETGPSQVAKLLSEEFDVRVLNAGVRAYNTLQAKRTLEECLERFDCIEIVVYTHCGNDLEENMVANIHFPCKSPVVARDSSSGEFRVVEVTDPAVPWGESFRNWRSPAVAADRGTRRPHFVAQLETWLDTHSALWHHSRTELVSVLPKSDNTQTLPHGTDGTPPSEYANWNDWAMHNGADEILQRLLGEMLQTCRDHGAAFLATTYYTEEHQNWTADFAEYCDVQGVRFVTLKGFFPGESELYTCRQVDGRYDAHYGALGTKSFAAALAPTLAEILRSRVPSIVKPGRGE